MKSSTCTTPYQMIPFLLVDGQYMQVGVGFTPEMIQEMSHDAVRAELDNPNSATGKPMRAEIDNIIALLCKCTGGKGSACDIESIKTLTAKL